MSDEELTALTDRLQSGDLSTLPRYLELQRGKLMAFIEHRLGAALRKKVEPDDIWQEASIEAIRSAPQINLSQRDPFSWLCQVAERRIVDAHRHYVGSQKRSSEREVSIHTPLGGDQEQGELVNLLVASMTTASQKFARSHREKQLLAAMAELPADMSEALRLRYLENLPSKEIAERLGKTDGAVRVMLTRALDKLQKVLGTEPLA